MPSRTAIPIIHMVQDHHDSELWGLKSIIYVVWALDYRNWKAVDLKKTHLFFLKFFHTSVTQVNPSALAGIFFGIYQRWHLPHLINKTNGGGLKSLWWLFAQINAMPFLAAILKECPQCIFKITNWASILFSTITSEQDCYRTQRLSYHPLAKYLDKGKEHGL